MPLLYNSPYLSEIPLSLRKALDDAGLLEAVSYCFFCSNYIASRLVAHPDWIEEIFLKEGYLRSVGREDYLSLFAGKGIEEVRGLFRREHLRLGVRDLLRAADTERILRELSFLADAVVSRCLEIASQGLVQGQCPCSVVALGKLGGEELNYYSDVDLMYVYRGTSSEIERYTRLFSRLNRLLSEYAEGGPIYNVDLRLRPQGRKGLLCMPVEAYEAYYEAYGRTWERAMLIRARHCAGDAAVFKDLMGRITPFIYRKHLDFSAIEEIRRLKESIDQSSSDREDIKTGRGGIREVEFVVQAFQLVFGGRNPNLRVGNLFLALHRLRASGLLGAEEHSILYNAYRFYRRLENRIQMLNCTQTQKLPSSQMDRIAVAMGYRDGQELLRELSGHREGVRRIFEEVMTPSDRPSVVYHWKEPGLKRVMDTLTDLYGIDGEEALAKVVEEAQNTLNPSMVVKHLADIVGSMRYTEHTFLRLLVESPGFRRTLVEVLGNSQYLARMVLSKPQLLDVLFSGADSLEDEGLPIRDVERLPREEVLSRLKELVEEQTLLVGFLELSGVLTPLQVFSRCTRTAEVFLRVLHNLHRNRYPVVVLGLGKLGSRELTYHSDLDVIFVSSVSGDDLHRDYYLPILNSGVYEVDVRLRPFGSKGLMVSTPELLREYFSKHGRIWEKLAYSRCRVVVADDEELARSAMEAVEEFVYAPVDGLEKGVFEMRMRLERELGRSPYNVKYSSGGVVDIEFVGQYLAVKHGIRRVHPLAAVAVSAKRGLVDGSIYERLKANYLFLRRLENILRLVFYPPLKELPRRGEKLFMAAKAMGMDEHTLLDAYMEVKESNRRILKEVLDTP